MKKSFLFFLLFSLSLLHHQANISQTNKPTKINIEVDHFSILKHYVESLVVNHPIACSSVISLALWTQLYPQGFQEIKQSILKHPHIVFSSCIGLLGICYANKEKIAHYFNQHCDQEDQQNIDNDDNDYATFLKLNIKVYQAGEIQTTFDDIAGLQTAKEDLTDILLFLKDSTKFNEIGAEIPKGILLSGNPGNGKTLLARAMAGECECPFLYVSASSFTESFVGVGAARIRFLFALAKELAPCIIFIDEIDAIGRKRYMSNSGSDSDMAQTLNQLLSEMDGFEQHEDPIVVIGATNRANILDNALTRPGRFDRSIEIHSPYIQDRIEILNIYLNKIKTTQDINVEKIACGTVGFSGAELKNLINEAALLAVRAGKTKVDMSDIEQARDFMLLGRETKGMILSENELWQTAIHESGHALAHVYQKNSKPLYKVTITPRGKALGITHSMNITEKYSTTEEEIRAEIVAALSGSVAEELILKTRGVGAQSDLIHARKLATGMVFKYGMTEEFKDINFDEFVENQVHLPESIATKLHHEVNQIINQSRTQAIKIITEHQAELISLAQMLMNEQTVSGEEVYKLCKVDVPNLQFNLN